jgi:hypothetical protein
MSEERSIIPSPSYLEILSHLHSVLKPRTYLEIGTHQGASLQKAHCASLAIDPQICITDRIVGEKPVCLFFQMTSDQFFADFDPTLLLGAKIDIAFLDGMHLCEYLLRDFMHVEAYCRPNSIIAVHDAIPSNLTMAQRVPTLGAAWTGDVWKAILLLKRYRPELKLLCLDSPPTGLVLITNLNPQSRLLPERYFSLLEEVRDVSLGDFGIERYREEILVTPGSVFGSPEAISREFWL